MMFSYCLPNLSIGGIISDRWTGDKSTDEKDQTVRIKQDALCLLNYEYLYRAVILAIIY